MRKMMFDPLQLCAHAPAWKSCAKQIKNVGAVSPISPPGNNQRRIWPMAEHISKLPTHIGSAVLIERRLVFISQVRGSQPEKAARGAGPT